MDIIENTLKIRDFLSAKIGSTDFSNDDDLFKQGFINSLFAMELVIFVETEFGITVESEDLKLDNFRSVDAISKLIQKNKI